MICPVCNVQLVMTERQGIEIDYCLNAEGFGSTGGSWIRSLSVRFQRFLKCNTEKVITNLMVDIMANTIKMNIIRRKGASFLICSIE